MPKLRDEIGLWHVKRTRQKDRPAATGIGGACRPIPENIRLNLFGGVLCGGPIELENSNGGDLADSDFDPTSILPSP